jgi:hypothetical protein
MNLPSFTVKNFTDATTLKCKADDYRDDSQIGEALVHLIASGGSCSFQHSMTPTQARELADALHACANALETEVMEVAMPDAVAVDGWRPSPQVTPGRCGYYDTRKLDYAGNPLGAVRLWWEPTKQGWFTYPGLGARLSDRRLWSADSGRSKEGVPQ